MINYSALKRAVFRIHPQIRGQQCTKRAEQTGTGFVIRSDNRSALALTAAHVIPELIVGAGGVSFRAELYDGSLADIGLVAANYFPHDIALISISVDQIKKQLPVLFLSQRFLPTGSKIFCFGFNQASAQPSKPDSFSARIYGAASNNVMASVSHPNIFMGFSGAPFIYRGRVIGLMTRYIYGDDVSATGYVSGPSTGKIAESLVNWRQGKKTNGDVMPEPIPDAIKRSITP